MKLPKNYYFLIPIIGGIPWAGMLIAMLSAWSLQGHPIYWFIHSYQFPLYISHIGATNLKPLFISCASWQGIMYTLTIIIEYFLRKKGILQFWFRKNERNLLFAAVILGIIGQLGLMFCSIFDTKNYSKVHHSMLAVFVVFVFLSMVCLITQYILMGIHYRKIHVNQKFWNKFMVSALLKAIWTILAVIFAILFAAVDNNSISSCFEWTLAFWYLVLFCIFSWDLSSASKHKHKNYPYIHDWNDQGYYLYDKHFGSSKTGAGTGTGTEQDSTSNSEQVTNVNHSDESTISNQIPSGNELHQNLTNNGTS